MSLLDPAPESPAPGVPPAAPRVPFLWLAAVFVVTLLIYAVCTGQILLYTNPPTGDQPFYLHTAISIVQDHDIEESNNYRNQDEAQYYPRTRYAFGFKGIPAPWPLPPHNGHTTNRPANEMYSKHGLGLSVLIVPGWLLGVHVNPPGVDLNALDQPTGGWPMVVYQLEILGALLAVQVFLLAFEVTRRPWIAVAVWAALAFSNPLMTYSYLIFPELPAGLCTIYAFRRLALGWNRNGPGRLLLIGVCMGFLPWLHARFLPLTAGLALFALWQWWQARRAAIAEAPRRPRVAGLLLAAVPVALSGGLLMYFYDWLYGTVLPNTGDHAGFIDPRNDPLGLPVSMLGLLLDQQWGLLLAAPIYVLAFVGAFALWGTPRKRTLLLWLVILIAPYYLLVADYRQWWGEWCPPARYLATIAPLLAAPLAQSLLVLRRSVTYRLLFGALAAAGWAIMGAFVADPHSLWNQPTGQSAVFTWFAAHFHVNLVPHLPAVVLWSWDHANAIHWDLLLSWTGLALSVILVGLFLLQETHAAVVRRLAFRHYRA